MPPDAGAGLGRAGDEIAQSLSRAFFWSEEGQTAVVESKGSGHGRGLVSWVLAKLLGEVGTDEYLT